MNERNESKRNEHKQTNKIKHREQTYKDKTKANLIKQAQTHTGLQSKRVETQKGTKPLMALQRINEGQHREERRQAK
jgi:hypothetical protein